MHLNHVFVGPASTTLIVFLHEGLGSIPQWKSYPVDLCNALNVRGLVYDRTGYGRSSGSLADRKPDYLHQAANELSQIIESIKADFDQIILYGHSDGGSIALIAAAELKNQITALITEAAHVFVEPETIKGVREARPLFHEGLFDGLKKYHGDRYKEVFFAWNDIWLTPAFTEWDITHLLSKVHCPQLIIQGKDDQYGTLKQVDTIARFTKGKTQTLILDQCGHAPHKEQKSSILTSAVSFIESIC